ALAVGLLAMEALGAGGSGMKRLVTLLFHDLYQRDPSESGFLGPGADRYKLSLADFDRQIEGIRRVRSDAPVLLSGGPGGDLPAGQERSPFAISVDDGGISYYGKLAGRLEDLGWRGHCLVTTGCIGRRGFMNAAQLRELAAAGHVIGSHSVTHPARFSSLDDRSLLEEWRRSRATLEDLLGRPVHLASVPGGFYSRRVALAARAAGYRLLFNSEPERRLREVEGCLVVGRHSLRRDSPAELSGRLVAEQPTLLLRE